MQQSQVQQSQVVEESRIADAVRAALGDLTPQPREPESIADSETLFVDLGLNSLEYLELWTSIESRVGCRFDDEDLLGDLRTVGDVVRRTLEVCRAGDTV
jgi:acyl carrier protein